MAHVWTTDAHGAWRPVPLAPWDRLPACHSDASGGDASQASQVSLLSTPVAGCEWGVLAPRNESLRINGEEILLGLRILSDRDELSTVDTGQQSRRWYFSTEEVVQVVPFPGSDHITRCPRCKQGIEAGAPAVRCPNPQCGAWHHQVPAGHEKHRERECWTYATKCALCSQPTALDAGFRWTPEEL